MNRADWKHLEVVLVWVVIVSLIARAYQIDFIPGMVLILLGLGMKFFGEYYSRKELRQQAKASDPMTEPTRPIDQTLHVNELPPISAEHIETMSEHEAMEWIEQATNFYGEESRNDLIKRLIRARTLAYWWRTRNAKEQP